MNNDTKKCQHCKLRGTVVNNAKEIQLVCRARPPRAFVQFVAIGQGQFTTIKATEWPVVKADDWCGAFEIEVAVH